MSFPVEEFQNVRARVSADVKAAWDKMLVDRKISQQDALSALMEWIVREDPLTQAMLLDQVPKTDREELSRIVLRRLSSDKKR